MPPTASGDQTPAVDPPGDLQRLLHADVSRRTVVRALALTPLVMAALKALPARSVARVEILPVGRAPRSMPFPASHLGVRWQGSEAATVEARLSTATGWSAWRRLAVDHDVSDPGRLVLSGLIRAAGALQVQLRAAGDAHRLEVVAIDASSAAGPASDRRRGTETAPPEVVTRAQWGADESMRKPPPEFAPIVKLVVHHTVTENDDPDPAATVRAIYAYHVKGRGWNDIGYNFLIDAGGRIYEGRFARSYRPGETPTGEDEAGRGVVGAHAKRVNPGAVGVALLGDFQTTDPRPAAVDALVRLLSWEAARHGIDPGGASPYAFTDGGTGSFPNLAGHRDVGQTECPGDRLYPLLPAVRRRVAETIGALAGPVPDSAIPGFWTVAADGAVEAEGDAAFLGSPAGTADPVVGMAATVTGEGYWVVTRAGQVFAFGDARFFGSAAAIPLAGPVVHLEPTPDGAGYWLAQADGGILAFGNARFYGSAVHLPLVTIIGMAATPTGGGYWLATSDGRVFAFGDAVTRQSAGGQSVPRTAGLPGPGAPIVSIAASPAAPGYWLAARDGTVVAVDAPFRGSVPGGAGGHRVVRIRGTETGGGYYVARDDGALYTFGDADQRRQRPGRAGGRTVVDVALRPLRPRPPTRAA